MILNLSFESIGNMVKLNLQIAWIEITLTQNVIDANCYLVKRGSFKCILLKSEYSVAGTWIYIWNLREMLINAISNLSFESIGNMVKLNLQIAWIEITLTQNVIDANCYLVKRGSFKYILWKSEYSVAATWFYIWYLR